MNSESSRFCIVRSEPPPTPLSVKVAIGDQITASNKKAISTEVGTERLAADREGGMFVRASP